LDPEPEEELGTEEEAKVLEHLLEEALVESYCSGKLVPHFTKTMLGSISGAMCEGILNEAPVDEEQSEGSFVSAAEDESEEPTANLGTTADADRPPIEILGLATDAELLDEWECAPSSRNCLSSAPTKKTTDERVRSIEQAMQVTVDDGLAAPVIAANVAFYLDPFPRVSITKVSKKKPSCSPNDRREVWPAWSQATRS
jgi:hypothetical protein